MHTRSRKQWRGTPVKRRQPRILRSQQTRAEALLWQSLRNRQIGGAKFRRQHLLCGYIVDFLCIEHSIIIEVDGAVHDQRVDEDAERTRVLEAAGYRLVRFTNDDVEHDIERVLGQIVEQLG